MVDIRNVVVLVYIIIGYISSIGLLLYGHSAVVASIGTLLLAHTLGWSGYMHHDLCHDSVFEERKWNTRVGRLLDWINGACYWTFEELRKQHVKHHIYKVDYDITSGLSKWIQENSVMKYTLLSCEYFYFPSHAYIIHWRAVLAPWWKSERTPMRFRTVLVFAIRTSCFLTLYYIRGPSILLCYVAAYSISIQVMRFTDAFSHTYEVVPIDAPRKYLSKAYDMAHTYSVVYETDEQTPRVMRLFAQFIHVGVFLNFNFHNQHHYSTQKKWYELGASFRGEDHPSINDSENISISQTDGGNTDEEEHIMNDQITKEKITANRSKSDSLCGIPKSHFTIPLFAALRAFHVHRLTRLFGQAGKPTLDPISKKISLDTYYGVVDAPLLILEL